MLAMRPASSGYWCAPISSRATPVAYGSSAIEPNELMVSGSRKTRAPTGGPPHASAFTATTSASISSMSIRRYGAAAEWSTMTRPPSTCISLVAARRSVTVPNVEDAEVTATSRVASEIRFSHPHARRRGVGQRVEQDRPVGTEDDTAWVGVDQIGDRLAGRLQHRGAALR